MVEIHNTRDYVNYQEVGLVRVIIMLVRDVVLDLDRSDTIFDDV